MFLWGRMMFHRSTVLATVFGVFLSGCSTYQATMGFSVPRVGDATLVESPREAAEKAARQKKVGELTALGHNAVQADAIVHWLLVRQRSASLRAAYAERADIAGDAISAFELPILGAAIAAAGLTLHEVYPKTILDVGLGAAALAAIEGQLNPRQRLVIYSDASGAMDCVEQLAGRAAFLGPPNYISRLGDSVNSVWVEGLDQGLLGKTVAFSNTGPYDLTSSIEVINRTVLNRLLSASQQPNYAQIRDGLLTAARDSAQNSKGADKAADQLAPSAEKVKEVQDAAAASDSDEPVPPPPFNAADKAQLAETFRFVSEFETQRRACIAMAGS
jgi:hypothetical protein